MLQRTIIASLFIAAFSIFADTRVASAREYVWGRSNFYAGPNRPVGAMGNGYGGYYVPRNAYGNNYEGRRFTNPNGFIVPVNGGQVYQEQRERGWRRR